MRTFKAVLLTACLTAASANTSPAGSDDIEYEQLAQSLLADFGIEDANPDTLDMEEFLAENFVYARLGLFELYMPSTSAVEKKNANDLKVIGGSALAVQEQWLEWLAPVEGDLKEPLADLKTLKGWVRSWSAGAIVAAAKKGERNLLTALSPKASVVEAANRFNAYMSQGTALGLEREDDLREPLILIPERTRFIEFISFGGWLYPHLQDVFWVSGIIDWTNTFIEGYKVIALQYAAYDRSVTRYDKGTDMNSRAKDGMQQQISQLAANSLIDNYYGTNIPPSVAGGLAINLVIDLFGECNTRLDGDLRARRTEAREIFIPGGQSQGGVLPKHMADTRWRTEQGKDRFVRALRESQKEGASEVKGRDKIRHFELKDDEEIKQTVISGPYLGAAAAGTEDPPSEFYGDHLEFLRAYRCCFMWWLRTKGADSKQGSAESFGNLLRGLAHMDDPGEIEAVFEESYAGKPLSTEKLEKGELEGAFLRWLAKN